MFKIGNLKIGNGLPPVIILDLGINHHGSLEKAIYLSDLAIKSGAKIIKHQTHIAEEEMSIEAKKIIPANANISIFSLIKRFSLSYTEEEKLMKYVQQKKCIYISTPFSKAAVDRLVKFKVPAFKIGSGECNNYPLIKYICSKKKPIILSTGMNDIKSISKSVKIIRDYKLPYALLHCTNIYPTPPKLVRLEAMLDLKKKFKDAVIGLSDHTETIYTSLGAISLGAAIVEKHFTDNKKKRGPDISASLDPEEFRTLNTGSKIIFSALKGEKKAVREEKKTIAFAFASIAATKNINKGDRLNDTNIFPIRPSTGYYKIKDYKNLIGKVAKRNILKGHQLKKNDI